jgi:hypothetical protein
MTGEWPRCIVDHKDCDRTNDRWSNLREATHAQNSANMHVRPGRLFPKGVFPCGRGFQARIQQHYLGIFNTSEEAAAAYLKAATELFGEFARAA